MVSPSLRVTIGLLPRRRVARTTEHATTLRRHRDDVDGLDLDREQRLDRLLDLDLVGRVRDLERELVPLGLRVGRLLRHHRATHDVVVLGRVDHLRTPSCAKLLLERLVGRRGQDEVATQQHLARVEVVEPGDVHERDVAQRLVEVGVGGVRDDRRAACPCRAAFRMANADLVLGVSVGQPSAMATSPSRNFVKMALRSATRRAFFGIAVGCGRAAPAGGCDHRRARSATWSCPCGRGRCASVARASCCRRAPSSASWP